MPAYVVGRLQIRDPSWRASYGATVPSLVVKHGGRYLARGGKMAVLEGNEPLPNSFVIVEFPSMEAARAFHCDAEYAPFIELRQAGSDAELVLVDGL